MPNTNAEWMQHVEAVQTPKTTFEYHAANGMVFTATAKWYEAQETLNALSVQAYENGTELKFVVIY